MKIFRGAIALLSMLCCAPLHAGNDIDPCAGEARCRVASNAELDELRGGFDVVTPAGTLHIDIGITRAVAINDRLVAVSQLVVPNVVVPGVVVPAVAVSQAGGEALIVQNGQNNVAPAASSFGTLSVPTIVQNTLDGQKLTTLTVVNASVNSLAILNALRLSEMMSRARVAAGR
jgi:hypothetical protein